MKRRLFKLAVFLLLGFLCTAAIAWITLLMSDIYVSRGKIAYTAFEEQGQQRVVFVSMHRGWGAQAVDGEFDNRKPFHDNLVSGEFTDIVPKWAQAPLQAQWQADINTDLCVEARGWPCLAFWCKPGMGDMGSIAFYPPQGGLLVQHHRPTWQDHVFLTTIPLRPLFPGFLIDIAFWGCVCWLASETVQSGRRALRIKRGLCPACAYPVGTSNLCTECGKPLTTSKHKAQIEKAQIT